MMRPHHHPSASARDVHAPAQPAWRDLAHTARRPFEARSPRPGTFLALVALLLVGGLPDAAQARPKYALQMGLPCTGCHINPSGGGMRNAFGRYGFAPTSLPMGFIEFAEARNLLDVDVSDTLAFGADARLAYIDQRGEHPPHAGHDAAAAAVPDTSTFFQMQADLYIAARPFDGLTLYYDHGAYSSFEASAIYEVIVNDWLSTFVKVGRFIPAFGVRLVNHNLFTREEVGFGPLDKDVGAELGLRLGPVLVQASVMSGAAPERQLDDNTDKAFVGRVEYLYSGDALRFMLGASAYWNKVGTATEVRGVVVDTRVDKLMAGLHAGLSYGRFTWLGELVYIDNQPTKDNPLSYTPFVRPEHSDLCRKGGACSVRSYQELDVRLVRGLELIANYEFSEQDLDYDTGVKHRISGGIDWWPIPYVELLVLYRYGIGTGLEKPTFDGFSEVIGFLHAFY